MDSHRRTSLRWLALPLATALSACGSAVDLDAESADALTHSIAAPSLQHGVATVARPMSFTFNGKAGDDVQPDVWPTAGAANALIPTLQLYGPPDSTGKRPLLAFGTPGVEAQHLSLEADLAKSGSYQIVVGAQSGHQGAFSLRLWSTGSHAPRIESRQVSLALVPSASVQAALATHSTGGSRATYAWSSDEIDAIAATIRGETEPVTEVSDIALLFSTLEAAHSAGLATDALVEKAEHLGEALVGGDARFAALSSTEQTLALYWFGVAQTAVFKTSSASAAASSAAQKKMSAQIDALVASWVGSVEPTGSRQVTQLARSGVVYGYQVNWQADLFDTDGKTVVFTWQSSDYFGADGTWLGESSPGALEEDDG